MNNELTYNNIGFEELVKHNVDSQLIGNLSKYTHYISPTIGTTNRAGRIDQTIFDYNDIDTKTIGLYVWLMTNSRLSNSKDEQVVRMIGIELFIDFLGIRVTKDNKQQIKKMFEWLELHQFIRMEKTITHKNEQYYNIYLQNIKSHYCKVYEYSIEKIVNESKGFNTLTKIGIYAAIRSKIFEEKLEHNKGGHVFNYGQSLMTELAHCSKRTYQNNAKWLCDHEILAYFIGTKKEDDEGHKGYKKRYMSEMKDHVWLTADMIGKIMQHELVWVSPVVENENTFSNKVSRAV